MSDFDREAERRRLEEKYEKDREKRESTQRMSELLLKGATMTNRHCDACGSPIFRYQGQEFCPTCQAAAEGTENGATPPAPASADAAGATDVANAGSPDGVDEPTGERAEASTPESDADEVADAGATADPERTAGSGAPAPTRRQDASAGAGATSTTGTRVTESVDSVDDADARASLLRALRTHADRAAETADPRRAKEHLAAAREAAEALAALDQ